MKKQILTLLISLISIPAHAFQDCVIFTDGKLSDINIENNQIIDVYPLITINNKKNTLILHPLQVGNTRFCVLKNEKNIVIFNVNVTNNQTIVDEVDGFEIFSLDVPNEVFELDLPPEVNHG